MQLRSMTPLLFLLIQISAPAQDDKRTDLITGTVLDEATGEPIRKVSIALRPRQGRAQPLTTLTGPDGKFRLHSIESGKYTLVPEKTGWVAPNVPSRNLEVEVDASRPAPPLTIKLRRAGVISGRVLDPDGDPMPFVPVNVLSLRPPSSARQQQPIGWARTDDRGEYRMPNIRPGRYRVVAAMEQGYSPNRGVRQRAEGEVNEQSIAPTYYPNALEPAHATVVQVAAGQELQGIDIQLALSRTVRVRGAVSGLPAAQQGRAMVHLAPSDGAGRESSQLLSPSQDGAFELNGVRPGRYLLAVRASTPDGSPLFASTNVEVGESDLEGLTLELRPTMSVSGRVILPEGQQPANLQLLVTPRTGEDFFTPPPARVGADGSFVIKAAAPGEYDVRVFTGNSQPAPDLFIASVLQGSQEVRDSGVRIHGSGADSFTVRLDAGAPAVAVTVQDDKQQPQPGAFVVLWRPASRPYRLDSTYCFTDSAGACQVKNLQTGEYLALALYSAEPGDLRDPELLAAYAKQAKSIKLAKGESATLELKAIPLD